MYKRFFTLSFIAVIALSVSSCSSDESDALTRGQTPNDGVTRDVPSASSDSVGQSSTPQVDEALMAKNADCPFLGSWKLEAIDGKELDHNQKNMTLTFFQDGRCEMNGAGKVRPGTWESDDFVSVSIKDPQGPSQTMEVQSIENGQMIFVSNGLDKITVSKVIETPVE